MPPFQYEPIRSPYVGSLADLMMAKGQIAARAAEQQGQIWGNTAQNIGQAATGAILTATDPRRQLAQQEVEGNKRALAYQNTVTKIGQSLVGPNGEQPTVDQAQTILTKSGIPIQYQKPLLSELQEIQDRHQEQLASAANVAYLTMKGLPKEATDDDRAHAAMAALSGANAFAGQSLVTPDAFKQLSQALASGSDPKQMAMAFMASSPKGRYKDFLQDEMKPIVLAGAARPGGSPATAVDPNSGKVIATGAAAGPAPMSETQLAADAATIGAPSETPTAKQSKATLDLLKPPKNPPSMQEQLLEAMSNGDTARANQITAAIQADAKAKRDPDAAAQAMAMRNLTQEMAKERLDTLRQKNAPLDISGSINTTMSGRPYIDVSEWQTPEDRAKAQKAAVAQGITPVNKDVAGMLSDLDTARQNQQTMLGLVESKLPKDAAGRLLKGPANTIEKLAQSDPELGAMGTFRNAAIQSMRAVAGSKGLRINQAEVQLAIDNDIPKPTDTLDTARNKLTNLAAFMENIEKAHLVRDRSAMTGTVPDRPVTVTDPRGGQHTFKNQADADKFKQLAGIK
jgi:hypothetical protein